MGIEKTEATSARVSLMEAFGELPDPRVAGRSKPDLLEMLVVTVCALISGVDDFVGVQLWAEERIDWLRQYVKLENGVPSHDTFGRLFGFLDRNAVEKGFRRWVGDVLPGLAEGSVVAIDGKASRRSRQTGKQALHMVSAFTTHASLVLGQEVCAEKSNELTAIPVLLETLMLKGVIVTIDAMGTHPNIAQAIRDQEADYILAVKDNQPLLAESIKTFFEIGQQEGWKHCSYSFDESVEKNHGRIEVRRCWAFEQIECLSKPEQWPDLRMFGVIEAERSIGDNVSVERRYYIGSTPPNALILTNAVRAHWGIENRVHWCLDVALNDDQMRARVKNAGANLAIIRRLVLNLFRLDSSRKGGINNRRILAASSDNYRATLLGFANV